MPTVAEPGTICTGDALLTPLVRYEFFAPPNLWVLDAIFGFFDDYTWSNRWTECGATTIDEASAAFSAMLASLRRSNLMIGSIVAYAGTIPTDPAILPCDGASYLRSDYPDLFAVIGTIWGAVDGTHFNVPDLRTRALVGAGTTATPTTWNVGDLIGEENHVLSTAETPAHTHTDTGHTHGESVAAPFTQLAPPVGVFVSAIPAAGITGIGNAALTNTGGGGAHNNTQLSGVVAYAIVAF